MSLNIESSFSLNGSLIRERDIIKFKEYGFDSLAIVDTTTAFFLSFYTQMKKLNLNPILGYRVNGTLFDVILYPKNEKGYKEVLYYASSINNKVSVDLSTIPLSDNLVYCLDVIHYEAMDTSLIDEIFNHLKENNLIVYLGVDFNYYPCEVMVYPMIKDKYDIIIINKVKYLKKEHKEASLVLSSILNNKPLEDANLFSMDNVSTEELKTKDELLEQYKDYSELINNTLNFTKLIDINIEFKKRLPKYKGKYDIPSDEYLRKLSYTGLKYRLENTKKNYKVYKERLDYELSIIHNMGFDDYFLVVYDYILYAKKNGIFVGPGRGSGASSLVSYTLGIIDIDPVEYNLYFERFLNPSRKTMPDIDTDFENSRKDDVIRYVTNKYGEYHVSLISTYQTFQAKSAISYIGKLLDIPERKLLMLSREIGSENKVSSLLKKEVVKNYYDHDSEYKELIDIALLIEGLPVSIGIHASGVIISDDDIREYSEVHYGNANFIQTAYDADTLEEIGLLKMDFLSLKNLSVLHEIVNDIKENENVEIDLRKLDLSDSKTFKMLREKSTLGLFQLESPGMNRLMKNMKVNSINDLALCIALFRPGPMDNIPEYLRRREGKAKIEYYHPSLKPILEETLGIIAYQEQLMAIVKEYAGFSLAEADILRRAISSKDATKIEELKIKFYEGAKSLKRDINTTNKLYKDIYKFANYGFNKSHAIVYSYIAYYEAYLKANYPKEFMISLLKDTLKPTYIKECQSLGIKVLPPDIRYSSYKYIVRDNTLYMPYTSIKGIGYEYAKRIYDVTRNVNINFENIIIKLKEEMPRSLIEDLIMVGAFDYTNYNKKTMIDSLDGILEFDTSLIKGLDYKVHIQEEYDFEYLKNTEHDLLGYNYKYHPIKEYKGNEPKLSDIELGTNNVTIVAYITNLRLVKTKMNETMATMYVEDEYIDTKAVIFSKEYYNVSHYLKNNKIYLITGSYAINRDEPQFVIRTMKEV